VTVAVTLFGLLELYKQGEAVWEQAEAFGRHPHRPDPRDGPRGGARAAPGRPAEVVR
jgi:hypothetical protein